MSRKQRASINAMAVCRHDLQFISLSVLLPGSVHDSRVFAESEFFTTMNNGLYPGHILADSGYPSTPFCLAFGLLKKVWQYCGMVIRRRPGPACRVILSCSILHNIRLMRLNTNPMMEEETPDPDALQLEWERLPEQNPVDANRQDFGLRYRAAFVRTNFGVQ